MSNNDLYNTSLKFLSKSLDKLEQNKPVNLALVNEINKRFLLMSPYNILVLPSFLLATNVNAVEPINAKEVAELKETFTNIVLKIKAHKDKKKAKLQELADLEAAEAAALTTRDAAQAALNVAKAAFNVAVADARAAAGAAAGVLDVKYIYDGGKLIENALVTANDAGNTPFEITQSAHTKGTEILNRYNINKNIENMLILNGAKTVYDKIKDLYLNNSNANIIAACKEAVDKLDFTGKKDRAQTALDTADADYTAAQARTAAARAAL